MLVALFDSELLCSPPSNRATKRLACVGFVWQADMGDEYDITIITTTTTTTTATATATATTTTITTTTTTTTTTNSYAWVPHVCAYCVSRGFRRVVLRGYRARGRIHLKLKILRRILVLLLIVI